MKNKNCICYAPFLRNSISHEYDFCYTCVKWWYLHAFFHFPQILIFQAVSRVKWSKMTKFCLSHLILSDTLETIHLLIVICGTQVWDDYISKHFFSFFQNFNFWVFRGVKGQKMTQNDQKLYLLGSITIHHMIFIYGTCLKG